MTISGKHLLTFAVVADTHMNQSEDYSSSPYPANALANARTRRVVAELNQAAPNFVIHLGDIVNPVPELPTYGEAAGHFKDLVADLAPPLHLVSGNHDVGDKPVSWMPAGTVCDEHIALYEQHFGAHYYVVDHGDLRIVVINAQIINSGLSVEQAQMDWLETVLADSTDKRVFVCTHYPPYVSNADENGSYDNIDEPGRSWLLDLIREHKPEALFCGHVHNFWYDLIGETETYILPSTAFVRHDYSEMYRIGPGDQYGRNDEAKLGYFLVRVYEQGHVIENIRTYGRTLDAGEALPTPEPKIQVPQTKESTVRSVGIDMRHAWAEELVIAPSGGVDEFERKLARNDYPVLAMWEMGLKRLRVPIQDILDARTRDRMRIMKGAGSLFQVYSYGVPSADMQRVLSDNTDLVDWLEIVINWEKAAETMAEIAQLKRACDRPVLLSRVNRKDANKHTGGKYNHLISHGFVAAEMDELRNFFASNDPDAAVSGIMMSILRDIAPVDAVLSIAAATRAMQKDVCLYVKSTSASPADGFENDTENACRVAEAAFVGLTTHGIDVILDTFDDTDRGYFARSGLVDRRFNPKIGSRVLGNMFGAMGDGQWTLDATVRDMSLGRVVTATSSAGGNVALALPSAENVSIDALLPDTEVTEVIDLDTGRILSPVDIEMSVPTLLRLG